MGHYCHRCQKVLANERFSGRGHSVHVCKECMRIPYSGPTPFELVDEILGFLDQSNISEKNRARLQVLAEHDNSEVREMALLLADIASIKPGKKLRVEKIANRRADVFSRMVQLLPDFWWDNFWADRMDSRNESLWEKWFAAKEASEKP